MKQFILLSLDATDEFSDTDDGSTNLVSVDSEHDTMPEAMNAFIKSPFSNKYVAQVLVQDENI